MQIFNKFELKPELSLALGFFDGVHLAHQKVIETAVDYAKKNSKKSAVITFKTHPLCFLYNRIPKYIISPKQRLKKFEELGVDYVFEIEFNEIIANMPAEEYLAQLIKYFSPIAITTGFNHHLGSDKKDCNFLKKNAVKYSYKYFKINPIEKSGNLISSSLIRKEIENAEFKLANSLLGEKFSFYAKVIRGRQIAQKLGFKTANINYPSELIEIPTGVYLCDVEFEGRNYKGIANYGTKPTFDGKEKIFEIHILNFNNNIYSKKIKITPIKKIREEKHFSNIDELKKQIEKDLKSVF